jgi:Ca2+-transporting ATPase
MGKPGGDDLPFVFSGTLVVQGQGVAEVLATGSRTELGKIGKALQALEVQDSPLKRETGRLVRNLAMIGAALCVVVIAVYGATHGDWTEGLLAGITLAMAMLPEEFPVVLTIFMALGAWRIAQKQVLTRRVPAIETLGSATVLCSDKTGTLTQNRMTVVRLAAGGEVLDLSSTKNAALPEGFHKLLEYSILASQSDPFDPMEKALRSLGGEHLKRTEHLHDNWTLLREYPLSPQLLALSHVWRSPDGENLVIASKGAPEAIADLCHFDETARAALSQQVLAMADDGLRVLGVARATFQRQDLPSEQHDFEFEFVGLVAFADPIRATVPAAIAECRAAGIRVIMITGDYPGTARKIAKEIGFAAADDVITGPELDAMSEAELQQRIRSVNVFARVVPEQKLRLVQALKANGEIVAMTGDGVNDAPALKAAHIGIAMGARGTDVAREASALVLLDDDFASIVSAVRVGRRIYDNLQKAMAYIFAIHVPIAGLSLIPVILRWPLVLLPVHIVFLELLIDPACSVVFEAEKEEADVMSRPPRPTNQPLFGRRNILLSLIQGLSVLVITLAVFAVAFKALGLSEGEARGLTFATLIVANLGLIVTNRSWTRSALSSLRTPNAPQWWVMGGGALFLTAVLSVPVLRRLFRFEAMSLVDGVICLAAGVSSILCFEAIKYVQRLSSHR